MKTAMLVLLLTLLAAMTFSQTENPTPSETTDFPVTGLTARDLATFFTEINLMMPVGPKIVSVQAINDSKIVVMTVDKPIKGPLSGSGERITFLKENGKWIISAKETWIS